MSIVWQRGPLGEEYERYTGRIPLGTGWKRGLANWDNVRAEYDKLDSSFLQGLSISQFNSLRLLLEWWNSDSQLRSVMESAEHVLRTHADGPSADKRVPSGLDLSISRYHATLFSLFLYEFYFYGKDSAAPIQLKRQAAAKEAACQRLSYWTYYFHSTADSRPLQPPEDSSIRSSPSLHNTQHLGAIIEPCPWLSSIRRSGMPYYLWDIEEKRTVTVSELHEAPQYSILSHTWGRWRLPGPRLSVSGVPWKVPGNTRFDVEQLPNILLNCRSAFLPTPYLWIDLFCIPQDRSPLGDVEISRQAAIFGEATKAIVWLNDITEWTGIQGGLQWLAAKHLRLSGGALYNVEPLLPKIRKLANTPTNLFKEFKRIETSIRFEGQAPSGWFTSLWTLQESFLRPEMSLCNAKWEVLKICDDPDSAEVTVDSIIALVDFDKKNGSVDDEMPISATEITALVHHICFDELLEPSPLSAFTLGNRRVCTERRAEAIMSVFGATDWFLNIDPDKREENLVLEKYPLQFLEEVRGTHGAMFFASNYGFCCFWDIFRQNENGSLDARPVGTLLPFDPVRNESKFTISLDARELVDHPSVATWRLAEDGRVLLPEVGVVASTDESFDTETNQSLLATVMGPSTGEPLMIVTRQGISLQEWMTGFIPELQKHAICLIQGRTGWSRGIILMEVYEGEEPLKTFAKIADYYTNHSENPVDVKTFEVDWEVL